MLISKLKLISRRVIRALPRWPHCSRTPRSMMSNKVANLQYEGREFHFASGSPCVGLTPSPVRAPYYQALAHAAAAKLSTSSTDH